MFDSRVNTWWKNVLETRSAKALRQTCYIRGATKRLVLLE